MVQNKVSFPANHLAMVLTKQTYNTQDKDKKPKDIKKQKSKHRCKLTMSLEYSALFPRCIFILYLFI